MLDKILKLLKNNGKITHLDNTIVVKNQSCKKNILERNIKILNIKIECISIKATTTEKMGLLEEEKEL